MNDQILPLFVASGFAACQLMLADMSLAEVRDFITIDHCYDGDTCRATSGERIRLACIDAPEIRGRPFEYARAVAARDRLQTLVVGQSVTIRRITRDRFGRTVGELFVDGANVQQILVADRFALIHPRYAHQCPWSQ